MTFPCVMNAMKAVKVMEAMNVMKAMKDMKVMKVMKAHGTWHVLPIQPNTGQFVDEASRGPLDAISSQ